MSDHIGLGWSKQSKDDQIRAERVDQREVIILYLIGSFRSNILERSKRIRSIRADRMIARTSERRTRRCRDIHRVDKK